MQCYLLLLVASIVVAYNMQTAEAKFSFALPGKWGASAKRGGPFSFSLPGRWGNAAKRNGGAAELSCEEYDPDAVYAIYNIIQHEALRLAECMNQATDFNDNETTEPNNNKH